MNRGTVQSARMRGGYGGLARATDVATLERVFERPCGRSIRTFNPKENR